jgi:hypothetical protein
MEHYLLLESLHNPIFSFCVVIFSKRYLQKYWTTWELMVILTLVITHKIRIIPFITNDITYEQIIERYPIMAPIKFERIRSCNEIVSLIKSRMSDACRIYDDVLCTGT